MDNIKLKYNDYNILLIGTGATGSNLLPPLCQLLNNRILLHLDIRNKFSVYPV